MEDPAREPRPRPRARSQGLPPWAAAGLDDLAAELETDLDRGLAPTEAAARLELFGPNEIGGRPPPSPVRIFLSQFTDFMVLVLIAAAAVSLLLGDAGDTAAILAIVVLNAVLGFIQEYRAERAMEHLRELAAPTARVVRGGSPEETIPAAAVVPGDVVLVEAGDRVPADMRIIEAHGLQAQEAALTGESAPVQKSASAPKDPAGTADLPNVLFMGTEIVAGRGRGLVVATGMETEFGKVAGLIQGAGGDPTPLQSRLSELGRYLVLACLAVSALVVWAGLLRGEELYDMILAGVSLAVAAIPEGLPAVVTIVLALGVQRMIRRNVIVRKLPAVETLGCATVVCSDKTGTLTENEMTVRRLWTPARSYIVTGQGFDLRGTIRPDPREGPAADDAALRLILAGGVLCSNAHLEGSGNRRRGRVTVRGDPTEGALLVAGAKAGLLRAALQKRFPRTAEIPFSSERRRMTTVHRWDGDRTAVFCKGAPDTILELSTHWHAVSGARPLSPAERDRILAASDAMAGAGLRVLGVAYRILPGPPSASDLGSGMVETGLVFAGLVGMSDPPRREARGAVEVCRRAGVKVTMITGDHPATAVAVARELDLFDPKLPAERQVVTGRELDRMSDRTLAHRAPECRVYARVSPGHKLRIVRALRRRGEVVAMTGDGVNDAPAVREADIGVAMGQTGTAVTKEASDMVLTDDNFASIVAALEEGRVIYDNIRRFIRYLLACNTGEVLTMLLGAVFRLPLPLLPIQILWVNLVTDGLPAMALGLQAPEADVTSRPPRSPRESIFARGLGFKILVRGVIIGLSTVAAFVWTLKAAGQDLSVARTVAFATLVLCQLVHAYDCRSDRRAYFEVPLSSNWYLVGATTISLLMLLAVIYVPAARPFFRTAPLGPAEWALVVAASTWGQVVLGLRRGFLRRSGRHGSG